MSLAYAGFTPTQLAEMYGNASNRGAAPENMRADDWERMRAQQQADADEIRRNRVRVKPKGQPTPKAPQPSAWQKGLSTAGRTLTSIPGRLAGGLGLALYPSELGSGTMDSPEAQRAIARNAAQNEQPPEIGFAAPGQPGSDVPFLVQPELPPAERAAEIERQAAAVREGLLSQGRQEPAPPGNPWAGLSDAQIQSRTNELLNQGRPSPTPRQALGQRGFSRLEQDFSAGDGSRPADIYYKEDADAGTTRYEIPGTTGFAEFQGQRKGGGSFSVMPGLSAADKKRYAELKARDQRKDERKEYVDFANSVMKNYGDNPAVAIEILKQAEASMQTRASTEQAGLQAARESQQAQREAMEDRRRWEAEYGMDVAKTKMDAVEQDRRWARDIMNDIPEMNDEEAFGILENFMGKDATGKPLPFQENEFQETFNIRPLTKDAEITIGQLYFNAAEGRYELATPEGLKPLGGHADVLRYRYEQMRNRRLRRLGQ